MTIQTTNKNLAIGSLAIIGGRVFNAGSQLLITAILSRKLEPSAFGLWALLYTIYSLMPNADLGLGQALRLKLAHWNAIKGNELLEQKTFFSTSLVLLIFGVLAGLVASFILHFQQNSPHHLTIIGFALICGLTISLNLGFHVFFSYGESTNRGFLDIIQAIVLALTIIFLSNLGFNQIIIGYYIATLILGIFALYIFLHKRKWKVILPSFLELKETFLLLWKSSLWFWLLALFGIILYATSPLFIAYFNKLEKVGDYSILQRLFSVVVMFHLAWLAPKQSAYTQAAAIGDWVWIRKTWWNSLKITSFGVFSTCLLVIAAHQPLVFIWTGRELDEWGLILALAFSACIWTWVNTNSVVLNGLGIIRPQAILLGVSCILFILLNFLLIPILGLIGAPIATFISMLPISVMNFIWVNNYTKKGLR